jgi:hypothetical protein
MTFLFSSSIRALAVARLVAFCVELVPAKKSEDAAGLPLVVCV